MEHKPMDTYTMNMIWNTSPWTHTLWTWYGAQAHGHIYYKECTGNDHLCYFHCVRYCPAALLLHCSNLCAFLSLFTYLLSRNQVRPANQLLPTPLLPLRFPDRRQLQCNQHSTRLHMLRIVSQEQAASTAVRFVEKISTVHRLMPLICEAKHIKKWSKITSGTIVRFNTSFAVLVSTSVASTVLQMVIFMSV